MQTRVPKDAWDTTSECPVNSPCKASRTQLSYLYGASAGDGRALPQHRRGAQRFQQNETLVPPHIGKLVAYVSSGQVSFGLTSVRIPQGGSNIALGEVQDISSLDGVAADRPRRTSAGTPRRTPATVAATARPGASEGRGSRYSRSMPYFASR